MEAEYKDYQLVKAYSDERVLSLKRDIRRRDWIISALTAMASAGVGGCVYLGRSVKSVPVLFFADRNGNVWAGGSGSEVTMDDRMRAAIKHTAFTKFVTDWRTVTTDGQLRDMMWDSAMLLIGARSAAAAYMNTWYRENNPEDRAQKQTVQVLVETDSEVTPNTYEIWWTETAYPLGTTTPAVQRYRGIFTYSFNPPQQVTSEIKNLLGLYISQISISPIATKEGK